ncbi:hypothetical protein llap_7743 [Limosa lapponica baueri]|uniref:Uncharacterized protein n=1 Tax=Limosa lapponica baueri TaxID=1758121 RepID=A0A2I0U787_LIMLA|nr:hypothetical protein llap_7743 [Limosa lapponica baueri]
MRGWSVGRSGVTRSDAGDLTTPGKVPPGSTLTLEDGIPTCMCKYLGWYLLLVGQLGSVKPLLNHRAPLHSEQYELCDPGSQEAQTPLGYGSGVNIPVYLETVTPLGNGESPGQYDHKLQISAHLLKTVAHVGVSGLFLEGDFAFLKASLHHLQVASSVRLRNWSVLIEDEPKQWGTKSGPASCRNEDTGLAEVERQDNIAGNGYAAASP